MKRLAVVTLLVCGSVQAEGVRLGMEYELEKDRKSGKRNHAVTLEPGWEFSKDSPLNLIELLIERNQEVNEDDRRRSWGTKVFLRLRHKRNLTENSSYYLRGGVGRNFNSDHSFTYAYIEPGLRFELDERWEWTFGIRYGNAIDGTHGERFITYITGPSFALDKRRELELRYFRHRGDEDAWSLSLGYIHRF